MKTGSVPLSQVDVPAETQSRIGTLDPDHVDELIAAIRRGDNVPPILVVLTADAFVCVDGFHRYAAHIAAGKAKIAIEQIAEGDLATALWHASAANAAHGLRRTNADKRRAVSMALEVRPEASTREIARHCRVSRALVAEVRTPDSHQSGTEEQPPPQVVTPAEESAGPLSLPGGASASEDLAPTSDAGSLPADRGSISPLDALIAEADAAAEPVLAALRTARREALKLSKGEGVMARSGAYVAPRIRELRVGFEANLPVRCPRCEDGCDRCGGKGWVRARSVDNA